MFSNHAVGLLRKSFQSLLQAWAVLTAPLKIVDVVQDAGIHLSCILGMQTLGQKPLEVCPTNAKALGCCALALPHGYKPEAAQMSHNLYTREAKQIVQCTICQSVLSNSHSSIVGEGRKRATCQRLQQWTQRPFLKMVALTESFEH